MIRLWNIYLEMEALLLPKGQTFPSYSDIPKTIPDQTWVRAGRLQYAMSKKSCLKALWLTHESCWKGHLQKPP